MSVGYPGGGHDHPGAGLYIWRFVWDTKITPLGLDCRNWVLIIMCKDRSDAQKRLQQESVKMGIWDEIQKLPSNLSMEFVAMNWLDDNLDMLFQQLHPEAVADLNAADRAMEAAMKKKEDEKAPVTLEQIQDEARMSAKNALMKKIVDTKDAALLQANHEHFTPEEVQYLHNKITA